MPELPDIVTYIHALEERVTDSELSGVRLASPFVLRTVQPTVADIVGRRVIGLRRLGKQIVFVLEGERFIVLHLMIAGRLHWKEAGAKLNRKMDLSAFDFNNGTLILREVSTKKRAALYFAEGEAGLSAYDRKALEVLDADFDSFKSALRSENHTLKRSLTDPRLFSGIGNAYSDEILHAAQLSPVKLTSRLTDAEAARLHSAVRSCLTEWIHRLDTERNGAFPEHVTAFRPEMAVHGRYGQPCPVCGSPVQRIVYAENEANYCPTCQTEGKILADRSMSRLLKSDWPRTLTEMEERRQSLLAKATPLEEAEPADDADLIS